MKWWRKEKLESTGSVLYRGKLPPRAANFAYLEDLGIELREAPATEVAHFRLEANHARWGKAVITCLRDAPVPPDLLVDFDPRLLPAEKELVKTAGSSVSVSLASTEGNVLRERKHLLHYLRAVMADDALAAVDHTAQAFWSRDDLDDELSHDAELDILSLFTVHALTRDDGSCFWMHTHGLSEIGHFDFDILDPSPDLSGNPSAWDVVRAMALSVVEENARWDGDAVEIVGGRAPIRFVPAAICRDDVGGRYDEWKKLLDPEHMARHAVACDPGGKLLGLFRRQTRPSQWLSSPLGEDLPILFSDGASELMAQRARATWPVFRRAREELAGLPLPSLAKLRYETPKGQAEHLWFEVEGCTESSVDATLVNQPWGEIGLEQGDRRVHDLERLSDWMMLTPAGSISPRSTRLLRFVREHRSEFERALAERD